MKNIGSHSHAAITKLLPDLDAQYRRACDELAAAQANQEMARQKVEQAETLLTTAMGKWMAGFPRHIVVLAASQIDELAARPSEPPAAPTVEPGNGAGLLVEER